MKKIYSLSAALMLAFMPALAQPVIKKATPHRVPAGFQSVVITPPESDAAPKFNAPQKADENLSILLEYCAKEDPYGAININNGDCGLAAYFPADYLAPYAGAQIQSVNVYSPYNKTKSEQAQALINTVLECTVFVTEELGGTPLAETKGILSTQALSLNEITLPTPITIESNQPLYIGVMFSKITAAESPYLVDGYEPTSDNACWIYSRFQTLSNNGSIQLQDNHEWKNLTEVFGSNVCISATVVGDNLPKNRAMMAAANVPDVVEVNTPFTYVAGFYNKGANALETIELELTVGEQQPQTVTANVLALDGSNTAITYDDMAMASGQFVCTTEGNSIPYVAKITKVNGQPNALADQTYTGYLKSLKEGFPVNVVVEELTSTTCSACPVGISGMEQTKEKYPDRFIPIAVHSPIPTAGDPMDVIKQGVDYYNFAIAVSQAQGGLSAPSSYVNRHFDTNVYPSPENLDAIMQDNLSAITFAKVEAELVAIDNDPTRITLNVTTTSSIDDKGSYGIAYSIVEDKVGPYKQTNGYAGSSGNHYGWESKPRSVSMEFNDVARKGSVYSPIAASTMTEFKAGEPIKFSTTVDLSSVTNRDNYRVVAMLINKENNYIENACVAYSPTSAVKSIEADTQAPVAIALKGAIRMMNAGNIYTLDGRMVAAGVEGVVNVPAGLYIAVTTQGAAKVMVR